jgi:hypothetical protein
MAEGQKKRRKKEKKEKKKRKKEKKRLQPSLSPKLEPTATAPSSNVPQKTAELLSIRNKKLRLC